MAAPKKRATLQSALLAPKNAAKAGDLGRLLASPEAPSDAAKAPAAAAPAGLPESPIFFAKGSATATNFRPSYWTFDRPQASGEPSPNEPPRTDDPDPPLHPVVAPSATGERDQPPVDTRGPLPPLSQYLVAPFEAPAPLAPLPSFSRYFAPSLQDAPPADPPTPTPDPVQAGLAAELMEAIRQIMRQRGYDGGSRTIAPRPPSRERQRRPSALERPLFANLLESDRQRARESITGRSWSGLSRLDRALLAGILVMIVPAAYLALTNLFGGSSQAFYAAPATSVVDVPDAGGGIVTPAHKPLRGYAAVPAVR